MTRCNECGKEIENGCVMFDDAWICMECHSKLHKDRDEEYYHKLLKGLKNTLKNNYMRDK